MGKKTLIICMCVIEALFTTYFVHPLFLCSIFADDSSRSGGFIFWGDFAVNKVNESNYVNEAHKTRKKNILNDTGKTNEYNGANEANKTNDLNEKYKELFKLYNDVELMKSRSAKYETELILLEKSIVSSEAALKMYEEQIAQQMKDYAELLKMRQRNGETSKIKLVLDSRDISDFLFRMNITSTIHHRYQELVSSLDENISTEMQLKEKLEADKHEVIQKNKGLEESIAEKEENIGKLEAYLQSKGSSREEYERQMRILGEKWSELKPLFASTIHSFVSMIEVGGLPNDVIEVSVSLGGVRGIVREEVFNRLLSEAFQSQENATEIVLHARDGGVYVLVPAHEVELFGYFDVSGNSLTYKVVRGSFSGIEIGESGIEDLFMDGMLKIDVTHILDIMNMELLDCKVYDGYIDVGIKLKY